jgi:hypothetical protein
MSIKLEGFKGKNCNLLSTKFTPNKWSRIQGPHSQPIFFATYKRDQQAKVFVIGEPFLPRVVKHSSLFGPFISYKENEVL